MKKEQNLKEKEKERKTTENKKEKEKELFVCPNLL